jgi:hypothetical protein
VQHNLLCGNTIRSNLCYVGTRQSKSPKAC